jgi:hypothetical protein
VAWLYADRLWLLTTKSWVQWRDDSVWDSRWTKGQWSRMLSEFFRHFPANNYSIIALHSLPPRPPLPPEVCASPDQRASKVAASTLIRHVAGYRLRNGVCFYCGLKSWMCECASTLRLISVVSAWIPSSDNCCCRRCGANKALSYIVSSAHPSLPRRDGAVTEEINTFRPAHELKGDFNSRLSHSNALLHLPVRPVTLTYHEPVLQGVS